MIVTCRDLKWDGLILWGINIKIQICEGLIQIMEFVRDLYPKNLVTNYRFNVFPQTDDSMNIESSLNKNKKICWNRWKLWKIAEIDAGLLIYWHELVTLVL